VGADVLSDRSADGRSGIVTFTVRRAGPDAVLERLLEAGIVCAARGGGVRVSPHGFNVDGDIDAVLDVVGALA
jgi:selenocysteine lyase/cysteine desulfurase